jgi:hypothetical protein
MAAADRIQAVCEDFKAALGRPPTPDELVLNLADRLDRAEAGKSPGFLRLPPSPEIAEQNRKRRA